MINFLKKVITTSNRRRQGVSIFEIILVTAISVSIVLAVTSFRGNLDIVQNFVTQRLQSAQDIKQTLQILTTEIRSTGPSSLGAYPVESASTSSFVFYSDIDKDGLFEKVRYFLVTISATSSVVKKGVIKPAGNPLKYSTSTEIITTAINNVIPSQSIFLFKYYDSAYTGAGPSLIYPLDPTKIRIVQFSIYADINPETSPTPEFFMATVNLRNLRSN